MASWDFSKIISPPYGDPESPLSFSMTINDDIVFYTFNTYGTDELRIDVCPLFAPLTSTRKI